MARSGEAGFLSQVVWRGSGSPVFDLEGVSFHLCRSGVVHQRTAVGADRRSVL